MPETEMDKETLFGQMRASYEQVEAALAALAPERWQASARSDGWTVKDSVAHMTAWLERLVEAAEAAQGSKPPRQPVSGLSDADVDAWNAEVYAAHRDDTAEQTLGAFRAAYGALTSKLNALTWDDLAAVGRYEWLGAPPLWRIIAEDTWEHFDEHLPEIERAASNQG